MNSGQTESKIKCCGCGTLLDGFTGLEDEANGPSDEDLTVCFYCGSIGKYAEGLTKMKPLTVQELEQLKKEQVETYNQVIKISDKIKQMRKQDI